MNELRLFEEGLKYAPSLIGIIIIVLMFLKYLQHRDVKDLERERMMKEDFDKRDKTITTIATQAFEVHRSSNEVIKENTKILGEVKYALEQTLRK